MRLDKAKAIKLAYLLGGKAESVMKYFDVSEDKILKEIDNACHFNFYCEDIKQCHKLNTNIYSSNTHLSLALSRYLSYQKEPMKYDRVLTPAAMVKEMNNLPEISTPIAYLYCLGANDYLVAQVFNMNKKTFNRHAYRDEKIRKERTDGIVIFNLRILEAQLLRYIETPQEMALEKIGYEPKWYCKAARAFRKAHGFDENMYSVREMNSRTGRSPFFLT